MQLDKPVVGHNRIQPVMEDNLGVEIKYHVSSNNNDGVIAAVAEGPNDQPVKDEKYKGNVRVTIIAKEIGQTEDGAIKLQHIFVS